MTGRTTDAAELAWLEARERDGAAPLGGPPHADAYQRLGEALTGLPIAPAPPGWDERVLAAIDGGAEATASAPPAAAAVPVVSLRPARGRRIWLAAGALAAAAVVIVVIGLGRPDRRTVRAPALAVRVSRGDVVIRAGAGAARGDTLHVEARRDGEVALWIYREATLVVRCPGDAGCRVDAATVAADVVLEVGTYRAVLIVGAAPAPAGTLDDDLRAAQAAGARLVTSAPTVVE